MATEKQSGAQRRQQILDEAWALLRDEGPAALSLRAIAKRSGIKLASLQYYFPAKKELDVALINDLIDRYAQRVDQIDLVEGPQEQFEQIVDMMLDSTPAVASLYYELGSLSQRDEASAAKIGFYADKRERKAAAS